MIDTQLRLVEKLIHRADVMPPGEREALKTVLCLAAAHLPPDGCYPDDPSERAALDAVISCLAKLQAHRDHVPPNGVVFRGRLPFLSDAALADLQAEAREIRRTRPILQRGHWLGQGGTLADALAVSPEMIEFVEHYSQPVLATGIASYLFYDQPNHHMQAHVDTGIFAINANLMLEHVAIDRRASYLFIYPWQGEPERIVFEPGEIVLSYAGSVVHGRAPLAPGEHVHILTVGFQPLPEDETA
jgi:hypothetical protein